MLHRTFSMLQVVGFSGTNDNRSLLPLQVRAQDTKDKIIKGTNGRMARLILQPGKCSFHRLSPPDEQDPRLAQRVLDLAMREQANAIIDAGLFQLSEHCPRSPAMQMLQTCLPASLHAPVNFHEPSGANGIQSHPVPCSLWAAHALRVHRRTSTHVLQPMD